MMLANNHEPFPAIAIDRAWNSLMSNGPFDKLSAMIGGDVWTRLGGTRRNLMRLLFHPDGIRPFVTNWRAVAPLVWNRAHQDSGTLWGAEDAALFPVLPLEIVKDGVRIYAVHGDRNLRGGAGRHRRRGN